ERVPRQGRMPTTEAVSRYERLRATWDRIRRVEDAHHVELCRELEDGFASTIHRWASGDALEDILTEADMAPGDFVRTCKQLLDLLRQIAEVATGDTAGVMDAARRAVDRGVVSYT